METATIYSFPMRKNVSEWQVIRLRAKGEYLGKVQAPDEQAAMKTAIKAFGLRPGEEQRLLVRRCA
jgi:hypothetical protein